MAVKTYDYKGSAVYLGSSKALVVDNKDPDKKGRIKVLSPVFGTTGFIPYLTPDDGFFSPPDIGSVVYLEPGGGDKDYPIATKTLIDGQDSDPNTPSIFRRDVPTNRGWVSPGELDSSGKPKILNGGHSLELDDGIATSDNQGNVTQTTENKGIRLTSSKKYQIEISDDTNRIRLTNKNGKYLDLRFNDDIVEIESSIIKVGKNAIEPMVLGIQWMTYMNTQIVPRINALITAVTTLASALPAHTHTYLDDNGSSVVTKTTSGPSPDGGAASGEIPSPSAVASTAQLAIKGKVE